MKHKSWHRVLTALLSVVLVVGLLPATALAAGPTVLTVNGTDILTATDNTVTCGNGTAKYDPAINTLTLTDVTIEGEFNGHAAIYTDGDLNIQLMGTNTITSGWYGIFNSNNNSTFTIGGSGTLTIEADNDCVRGGDIIIGIVGETEAPIINVTGPDGYTSGIYATKTLTIQNGVKIDAESKAGCALCGETGLRIADSEVHAVTTDPLTNTILTTGNLTIINSKVTASSAGYPALFVENDIEIENTTLEASSTNGVAIYSAGGTIEMTDSVVKAQGHLDTYTIFGVRGVTLTGTWLDNVDNEAYLANANTVENCVIIDYNAGTVVGEPVIKRDVELRSGDELTIPEGASLTIADGAVFRNNGTVILKGSFINNSAVVLCADNSHVSNRLWQYDEEKHWQVCALCGDLVNITSHDLVTVTDVPAGEIHLGAWHEECSVCDYRTDFAYSAPTGSGSGSGWEQNRNGEWEYYQNSRRVKGWIQDKGISYYLDEDYTMVTGWKLLEGKWYYFYSWGGLAEGWALDNGVWYYLDPETGEMATGWKWLNGKWYYLYRWGGMAEGWALDNGVWYYLDPETGVMQTGWIQWKGDWYYLYQNGAMAYNTTIEGYFLGADGAMR